MMQKLQEFNEQLYHKFVRKESGSESVHSYNSGISSDSERKKEKDNKESQDGTIN